MAHSIVDLCSGGAETDYIYITCTQLYFLAEHKTIMYTGLVSWIRNTILSCLVTMIKRLVHHAVYCMSLSCLLSFLCNPYIPFLIYEIFLVSFHFFTAREGTVVAMHHQGGHGRGYAPPGRAQS